MLFGHSLYRQLLNPRYSKATSSSRLDSRQDPSHAKEDAGSFSGAASLERDGADGGHVPAGEVARVCQRL